MLPGWKVPERRRPSFINLSKYQPAVQWLLRVVSESYDHDSGCVVKKYSVLLRYVRSYWSCKTNQSWTRIQSRLLCVPALLLCVLLATRGQCVEDWQGFTQPKHLQKNKPNNLRVLQFKDNKAHRPTHFGISAYSIHPNIKEDLWIYLFRDQSICFLRDKTQGNKITLLTPWPGNNQSRERAIYFHS